MDRLDAMTILLAAVDTGSLSAASRKLGIPLTTVSRRVSDLEEHLGSRLLLRGARKLILTDGGRVYVESCRRVMEDIAEAERTVSGEYRAPQGDLTISAPQVLGRLYLLPVVLEFLQKYPAIRLHLQFLDRKVNLLEEHVDVALRLMQLPDSSMVATRVASVRPMLCASPDYLLLRGTPRIPADLASHNCIEYFGLSPVASGNKWAFRSNDDLQTVEIATWLSVNSIEAAADAAVAGAGIARLASYQVDHLLKSGQLVLLLEAYELAPIPASLVYPSQRQVPLKLRAFLDFAVPRLRERLGYKNP